MNSDMERLAGIEEGDSNEVCLAKTMLAIQKGWKDLQFPVNALNDLVNEGAVYAGEVLNARE